MSRPGPKLGELWRRIVFLRRGHQFDREMEEELQFHAAMKADAYRADGADAREANYAAMRRLGNPTEIKERSRDMWGWRWLEAFAQDTRYAFRVLRKSPAFTFVAVLSLALGIGANTVVFSVLNALVLKALPIADAARVYFVNNSGGPAQSFPNYRDIRDRNAVFESLFAYRIAMMSLDDDRGAQRVWGYLATGNYFESLGIKPALGRFFTPAEDTHPNASPYAVLSYACWQNRFGGDPRIVGKDIRINGHPYTVLGVAPRGFHGTEVFYWSEIWVPMMMQPQIEGHSWLDVRNTFDAWVAGRLKPGVTLQQAEANLNVIASQLAHDYREDEGMRLTLGVPGMMGSAGREPTRAFAGGVMLLAALVLLAACANLASLLAARMADRSRDLAIRVSIGAGGGRIVRQLLTESLWIAMLGGAAGCALAVALLRLLSQWHAPLDFPVQFDVTPDWCVFLFACAAALATGILFGIGPARHAWKADPALRLKGSSASRSGHSWAARDVLLPVQIALCCVLVTASLVAVRGLMRSFQTPLGFRPDGAAVIGYDVGLAGYKQVQGRVFEQRALEAVVHLPGVESAAYSSSVPLSIDQSNTTVYSENTTDFRPRNSHKAGYHYVAPGYFQTAGTRLLTGREFTPQDQPQSPLVAIVNRTFARRVIGGADAVGRRFRMGPGGPLYQIVAIADRYHLVAPDYPGFGHSDWPDPSIFAYTFDHYAEIMGHFTEALGLSRYTLYMQDYGGPVGFRMALVHPGRIEALIVQDAVAHNEGLGKAWKMRRAFWADRAANESTLRTNLLSLAPTRTRHVGNDPNADRFDPDLWTDEYAFLNKPGQADIQSDLFYDYRTNVEAYPKWQAWMCGKQPRLLVIWGKHDLSFDLGEPERYRKDVPDAQVHVLDAGHFALDAAADEIAALVRDFVGF